MPTDSNGNGHGHFSAHPQAVAASTNGGGSRQPPRKSKLPVGERRKKKIRDAVLKGLEQRGSGGVAIEAPSPAHHAPRSFAAPPGLLPPELRRNLQGNILPQVSPSMMRRPTWNASVLQ